ncbi:MAG: ECF-type sigma factor [bacterium]|nr:ECF-type sigma factor [bacterium]
MSTERVQATSLLNRICDGEAGVSEELFPLVYEQLHGIARALLRQERTDHTLQATALVHEAYLRLVDLEGIQTNDDDAARRHFVAICARAMRRILVEHARGRDAVKRGGDWQRVTFDESLAQAHAQPTSILDLEAALQKLEGIDPKLVQAAELRLFGGLSVREMAPCLGLSLTRAKVVWASTRAMLGKLLDAGAD